MASLEREHFDRLGWTELGPHRPTPGCPLSQIGNSTPDSPFTAPYRPYSGTILARVSTTIRPMLLSN